MKLGAEIKAVCFDAFGIFVEIKEKRRPYKQLLKLLDAEERLQFTDQIMRNPLTLQDYLNDTSLNISSDNASALRTDIDAELASIELRPNSLILWERLRENGYKIAICSNLAADYGPPLIGLLPDTPDAIILRYKTGFVKPEQDIYRLVSERLSIPPQQILFSGDTKVADIDGPKAFGMQAMFINELEALL